MSAPRRYIVTLYETRGGNSWDVETVTREVIAYDAADAIAQEALRCSRSTFWDGRPTARVVDVAPAIAPETT